MSAVYVVLVRTRNLKKWRTVSVLGKTKFSKQRATAITARLKKRGRAAKMRRVIPASRKNDMLINTWLRGDLDFDRKMMVKLALVARDCKTVLYVNYGRRSYAEQLALWNKYGPPRAARPGTSRHETGLAADVVTHRTKRNIGNVKKIRAAMKKRGLCLPVPNEPWHVEAGNVWRA